jgi:SAM-dependent methyltransferase
MPALNTPDDDYPRLYHAHHSRHMDDLPFWLELAQSHGDPILELGCGSGRILLPLADAGYKMTGIEVDTGMLRVLKERLPDELLPRVELIQGDFTKIQIAKNFRLVILPCNTYSTLDTAQRQALLGCVIQHLQPEGVFVASLPNPALLRQLPSYGEPEVEEVFPHPLDGKPVQVTSSWQRSARGVTIAWDYDHESPAGRVEHIHREVHHQPVSVRTYLAELHQAGFNAVTLYGEFDGSAYREQAQNLILAAGLQAVKPVSYKKSIFL